MAFLRVLIVFKLLEDKFFRLEKRRIVIGYLQFFNQTINNFDNMDHGISLRFYSSS